MTREESDTEKTPRILLNTGFLSGEDIYGSRAGLHMPDGPEEILRKLPLEFERELELPSEITGLFPHSINKNAASEIEEALSEFLRERRKLIKVLEYRMLSKACSVR